MPFACLLGPGGRILLAATIMSGFWAAAQYAGWLDAEPSSAFEAGIGCSRRDLSLSACQTKYKAHSTFQDADIRDGWLFYAKHGGAAIGLRSHVNAP